MAPLQQILAFLGELAPLDLAESWDNVGLLVGEQDCPVERLMTCLTLTPDVADEAIRRQAQLIVAHHPVFFRAVQQLTTATTEGKMLLELIRQGISVYSPHTAFDSSRLGINQLLAERLGLRRIQPLRPAVTIEREGAGTGRFGELERPLLLRDFLELVQSLLLGSLVKNGEPRPPIPFTGVLDQEIVKVAIGCGSAGELLRDAHRVGCDLFLTGEARFHTCLEARELGVALVMAGHYGTERPGVEHLAEQIGTAFPDLSVWASEVERDPVAWS